MIFLTFIGRKYSGYLFTVSLFLGGVYTLIEVLEKIARYSDASATKIFSYAIFSYIPSFLSLYPLSALIATILLLRELLLKGILLSTVVYGISPRKLIKIVGFFSLCAGISLFLFQEYIGYKFARKMVLAKIELSNKYQPIYGWGRLSSERFFLGSRLRSFFIFDGNKNQCLIGSLCAQSQEESEQLVDSIDFQKELVTRGSRGLMDTSCVDFLASTFAEESLLKNFKIPLSPYQELILVDKIYFLLKIIFLPMLAVIFFFAFEQYPYLRWIFSFLSYFLFSLVYGLLLLFGSGAVILGFIGVLIQFLIFLFIGCD